MQFQYLNYNQNCNHFDNCLRAAMVLGYFIGGSTPPTSTTKGIPRATTVLGIFLVFARVSWFLIVKYCFVLFLQCYAFLTLIATKLQPKLQPKNASFRLEKFLKFKINLFIELAFFFFYGVLVCCL